jgi:predicted DNA-binding antitoxin AbrB/MazE fold protein
MPTRTQTVDAVYEHGVFRPTSSEPLGLAEGQNVRIVVQPLEQADAILALAAEVYAGLTAAEIAEVEQHSARRANFFAQRPDA